MGKMLVILPAIYLMKQIDFEDPTNLFYLRIGFAVVQSILFLVNGLIYYKIRGANNQKKIKVPAQTSSWSNPQPAQEDQIMTIDEYDMGELRKSFTQTLFVTALLTFLHIQWAVYAPLFIQSFSMPMTIYDTPLFKLHILGYPDEGELQRPFKPPPGPFAGLMPSTETEEEKPEEDKSKSDGNSNGNSNGKAKKKRRKAD
jgi:hypothetical protein